MYYIYIYPTRYDTCSTKQPVVWKLSESLVPPGPQPRDRNAVASAPGPENSSTDRIDMVYQGEPS